MAKTNKQMAAHHAKMDRWKKMSVLGSLAMSRRTMLKMMSDPSIPIFIRAECQRNLDSVEIIERDMRHHLGVKPNESL